MKMGLSRGLTNSPLDCLFRHFGAVALFRLAVPESGCASCAACLLRPPRLLRLPVSAAGGGRLCSKPSAPNTKKKPRWRGTPTGSLFGAEDGTFPRTKKQSTGLFFAACGRPCCSSPQLRIPNKNPHGGVRHGDLCLVRKMGLEPTRHRHTHLKRACLPIPALPQIAFDCKKDSSTFGGIKSSPILQLFPAWGAPVKSQHLFLCTVPRLAKIVCAQ